MEVMRFKIKIYLVIIALVFLSISVIAIIKFKTKPFTGLKKNPSPQIRFLTPEEAVKLPDHPLVKSLTKEEAAEAFPFPIFQESDAAIESDKLIEYRDGRFWVTRIYNTKTNIVDLQADYQKFFNSLGWRVLEPFSPNGNDIFLTADKNNEFLVVHLSSINSTLNQVELTFQSKK